VRAFGTDREQTPRLDCNTTAETLVLLQGHARAAGAGGAAAAAGEAAGEAEGEVAGEETASGNGGPGHGAPASTNGGGGSARQDLARIVRELSDIVADL